VFERKAAQLAADISQIVVLLEVKMGGQQPGGRAIAGYETEIPTAGKKNVAERAGPPGSRVAISTKWSTLTLPT
jgi:hypothetical protein